MTDSRRGAVWLGSVLALAGCGFPRAGPAPGPVSPDQVRAAQGRWGDATQASLVEGRRLFLERCNNCHGYPDRGAVAEQRWPAILQRMGRKADLDAAQTELVLRFVLASRARP